MQQKTMKLEMCTWETEEGRMRVQNLEKFVVNANYDPYTKLGESIQFWVNCTGIGFRKIGTQIYKNP